MTDPVSQETAEPETIALDTNNDGVPEIVLADVTGDGIADQYATVDEDGNVVTVADTDATPGFDTIASDFGGDGQIDVIQHDADADGYHETTVYPDGTTIVTDRATGAIVSVEPADPAAVEPGQPGADQSPIPPGQPGADLPGNEDPTLSEEGESGQIGVYGDAERELDWAQTQTENGFCAPVSVGMIVSEFYGVVIDETRMVEVAIKYEWLSYEGGEWSGMNAVETELLLEKLGIPAHFEFSETPEDALQDLRDHLSQNHGVVLTVDSDEVWHPGTNDDGLRDIGVDHALVVTEIDDINGTVTLNDPGNPNGGQGWVMSTKDFLEAWDDGGYGRVVTDVAPGELPSAELGLPEELRVPSTPVEPVEPVELTPGGPTDVAPTLSDEAPSWGALSYAGWVILPIVLARGVIQVIQDRNRR